MNEVEKSDGSVEETYGSEITVTEVESDSEDHVSTDDASSSAEEEPAADATADVAADADATEEEEPAAAEEEPAAAEEEPAAAADAAEEEEPAAAEEEPAAAAAEEEPADATAAEEEPAAAAAAAATEEEPAAAAEEEEPPAAEEEEPTAASPSNQKISEFQYLVEILGDWANGDISRSKFVSLWTTKDVVVNDSVDYESLLPDFGKIPKLMLEWNKNTNFDKTNFKNIKLYTSSSNMLADETTLENKLVKLDKIRDIILDCAKFNYKGRRKQLEADITELF